jgi:hypothetical protein
VKYSILSYITVKIELLKKELKKSFIKSLRVWIAQIPTERWQRISILETDIKFIKKLHSKVVIECYITAYVKECYFDTKSLEIVLRDDFPEFLYILERFLILK